MGKLGKEIVKLDVDILLKKLNSALADEWLAYYQYWIGAKVVKGPMKDAVISELDIHATEELGHATLIAARIVQLGGTPVLSPDEWAKVAGCGYAAPVDPYVATVLDQNIKGEQCTIGRTANCSFYAGRIGHHNMVLGILSDEVEHERIWPPGGRPRDDA